MEHVWFTPGIPCPLREEEAEEETGRREREWRKASVSRQREERPRESGWISFFPLEEIFTFSFVDYPRRRRRRLFKSIDARSGGREGGTPRVSVSTWTFVRGRRNASLLSSCRLSNPWRNIPFGSPFPFFPFVTRTMRRRRRRTTTTTSSEEIGVDWEAYAIMSFPPVDAWREEGDATLKNAIRVQRCRRDVSLIPLSPRNLAIFDTRGWDVCAISDRETQTKVDQFRFSICLNRNDRSGIIDRKIMDYPRGYDINWKRSLSR